MSDISKIDQNFKVSRCNTDGKFISIDEPPFKIYGVMRDDKGYCRMPQEIADRVNDGVKVLNRNTSGGIVRFSTNSPTLALKAENPVDCHIFQSMALCGADGFAAYEAEHLLSFYCPVIPIEDFCEEKSLCYAEQERLCSTDGFHDITLYMPLYGAYEKISLKVADGCEIRPAKNFRNEKPVVFYGSSITQGGNASSPAGSYVNLISRELDIYCVNLGFSGSARGEEEMANYIAGLDMSAFVLDYEHNAPTLEHLENTHKKFFDIIRSKNPQLPIIIASAIPRIGGSKEITDKWRNVIFSTYKAALDAGDKNVYFLNGEDFFSKEVPMDICTTDCLHPNDIGMRMMAKGFESVLRKLKF